MNPQMIRKIQQMQKEIEQAQRDIEATEFQTSSGPVTVVMYGSREIKSVTIDESFEVTGADDLEMLGDMVVAAAHKASEEISSYTEEKMAKYKAFAGGLF